MRNGSHRLALCIAAVAAGSVIAVPAASGGGFPDVVEVVKHDTKVTISRDRGFIYHGDVESEVERCEVGRLVRLFKRRPGADRKLGAVRTTEPARAGHANWSITAPREIINPGTRVYAKVTREVGALVSARIVDADGFVCRADRSGISRS